MKNQHKYKCYKMHEAYKRQVLFTGKGTKTPCERAYFTI